MQSIESHLQKHLSADTSLPDLVNRLVTRDTESMDLLAKADTCIKHLEVEAIRLREANSALEAKDK
jgi:hypothetical protein